MKKNQDGTAGWHKSSLSGSGDCVEVRMESGTILVRDTKDREGPVLRFSSSEWGAFLGGVRKNEFDLR